MGHPNNKKTFRQLEFVTRPWADSDHIAIRINDGPSEMDAMRSAFDGLLVTFTLRIVNIERVKLDEPVTLEVPVNARLLVAGTKDSNIVFVADICLVTREYDRFQIEEIGQFSGYFGRRGKRNGYSCMPRDTIKLLLMNLNIANVRVSDLSPTIQLHR